ncbi:MAG: topoisomerase DNA-binding C4 zinc finger domain-containing protein, partial [Candidatus Bathyarchaeota archaeon]|nr:topoisomerase DNA-binding C4 zinc finger domain-containing protein [Candidatus Bathyarchaeota archaeon]
ECDKCGSQMQLKTGRFGKFFGCTNASCKNTRKLLKNGEAAPPKMDKVEMPELKCEKVDDTYVLRDGASGLFLAASQFPKNRETRAPLVCEIVPHVGIIQPLVSRHLKILKNCGLVKHRKDGNRRLYSVTDPVIFKIIDSVTVDLMQTLSKRIIEQIA